jgi:hypothetical protein
MGKIVISTNVSFDGVVQDPDGKEGFRLGGWFGEFGGKDLEEWAKVSLEEALRTEALLLGRRSDEWFATRWLSRSGAWMRIHPIRAASGCAVLPGVMSRAAPPVAGLVRLPDVRDLDGQVASSVGHLVRDRGPGLAQPAGAGAGMRPSCSSSASRSYIRLKEMCLPSRKRSTWM